MGRTLFSQLSLTHRTPSCHVYQNIGEQDVQNGRKLVDALQRKGLPISAAFWSNPEEANEWRLVFVSPVVSAGDARGAYHMVEQALAETGVPNPLENISVLSPTSLRYKEVRLASQGVPSGVTLARNFGGADLAGDAYVYVMN
jgi:hypothetical protein